MTQQLQTASLNGLSGATIYVVHNINLRIFLTNYFIGFLLFMIIILLR